MPEDDDPKYTARAAAQSPAWRSSIQPPTLSPPDLIKKGRQQNARHNQYLEARRAKRHIAKIQRNITLPLLSQHAPQRARVPRGKVKIR